MRQAFLQLTVALFLWAPSGLCLWQSPRQTKATETPEYSYRVVQGFPHDPTAYTQGLAYRDGFLYEGTGLNGRSSIRKVRLETGEIVRKVDLAQSSSVKGLRFSTTKSYSLPGSHRRDLSTGQEILVCCAAFRTLGRDGALQPTAVKSL